MTDESKPNKSELIPSRTSSLVGKKSGLIKRGLELVQELKKQQVRVLIGNSCDNMTSLLSDFIECVINDKYDLKVASSFYAEEILEFADKESFDIFILVINNIRFRPVYHPQDRLEYSLQLITQIKTTYGRPVIALSGWLEDSSLIERVKLAADFFFPLPFKKDAFWEAIEKCLDMLPGFDEIHRNVKISKISEV